MVAYDFLEYYGSLDDVGGQGGQNDRDNQTVQTQGLGENQNQDHTDVNVLLSVGAHTGIASHADSETSSEGGKAAAKAGGEVLVTIVGRVAPGAGRDTVDGGLLNYTEIDKRCV